MKIFFMILPALALAFAAEAKTIECAISLYRISGETQQSASWELRGRNYSSTLIDLQDQTLKISTKPASMPNNVVDANLFTISAYLMPSEASAPTTIYLKETFFRSNSLSNDYYSMNYSNRGLLALTPNFIRAVKALGKWGEKPFDGVKLDHSVANPDPMLSNSLDMDYFLAHGGLEIAEEAFKKGLVSQNEPLYVSIGHSCTVY